MDNNDVMGPPDPAHDDLSNPGPVRHERPVVDNEAHDRNDDGPSGPESTESDNQGK
jgi:hypothetical protein